MLDSNSPPPIKKSNLKNILANDEMNSKEKIMEITSNEICMKEIESCLENNSSKMSVVKNNVMKLNLISFQNNSKWTDSENDQVQVVEIQAIQELLSEYLKIKNIKEIKSNEFEVHLEDKTQAQLMKYSLDGLELNDLNIRFVVSEMVLPVKNSPVIVSKKKNSLRKLSKKEDVKEFERNETNQKQFNLIPSKIQHNDLKVSNNNNQEMQFNMNYYKQRQFKNQNQMQMDYTFMNMQYSAQFNSMMRANESNRSSNKIYQQKVQSSKPKDYPLPEGILMISVSKNKLNTNKFTCRYNVMIENDKNFQVAKKIIGSKGCNMKSIIDWGFQNFPNYFGTKTSKRDGLKLRLRGKGSGFKEGPDQRESDEPLHLCISAKYEVVYTESCKKVEELLNKIYQDYLLYLEKSGSKEDKKRLENKSKYRFQKYEGNVHNNFK
jgi:hypothetical protein